MVEKESLTSKKINQAPSLELESERCRRIRERINFFRRERKVDEGEGMHARRLLAFLDDVVIGKNVSISPMRM